MKVIELAIAVGRRYGNFTKIGTCAKGFGHFFAGLSKDPPIIAPATPPKPQQKPSIA